MCLCVNQDIRTKQSPSRKLKYAPLPSLTSPSPPSPPLSPPFRDYFPLILQNWTHPGAPPTLIPRDTPLTSINRVPSIFANRKAPPTRVKTTPLQDAEEEEEEEPKMVGPLDVSYVGLSPKSVVLTVPNPDTSSVFYEQYCIDEDYFRLGKGVSFVARDCHVLVI